MNAVTRFVAVIFGPHRREGGGLSAPGDADCRWRVVGSSNARSSRDDACEATDGGAAAVEPRQSARNPWR